MLLTVTTLPTMNFRYCPRLSDLPQTSAITIIMLCRVLANIKCYYLNDNTGNIMHVMMGDVQKCSA